MDITAYRLREMREKIGLSQREVAERIGVTRAAYNKYECEQVNRFADLMNCPRYLAFRRTIFSAKMRLSLKMLSMKSIRVLTLKLKSTSA